MSSSERPPLDDLERDIPTTPEDVAALRRARAIPSLDPFAAVQRLEESLPPEARRQSRKTSAGWPDFEL